MNEKMKILEMLSEKLITVEEANELLKTLEETTSNEKVNKLANTNKKLLIKVVSGDGDKVDIALPIKIIKAIGGSGLKKMTLNAGDNDLLDDIDFDVIISAIDEGIDGDIVNVTSADGDEVRIYIE